MSFKHLFKTKVFVCTGLALATITAAPSAKAEGYIGGLIGYGIPLAHDFFDPGMVYGGTIGYRLMPEMSLAFTFLQNKFELPVDDYKVSQYLLEANFFSLVGLQAGLHAGLVKGESVLGFSPDGDIGAGVHLGMDVKLADQFSIGGAAYYTYVAADGIGGAYSILNLMVPLKIWF